MLSPGGIVAQLMYMQHRWAARWLDGVIVLDRAMAKVLNMRYARAKRALKVSVIPTWECDMDFPAERAFIHWKGLEKLGIAGRFIILYTGNAGRGHEFDTVLQAAQILSRGDPAAPVLLFAGYGVAHALLAHEKEVKGLENVFLHGPTARKEFLALVASGDVSLITLRAEMQGLVSPSKLNTALALGRPILYVGPEGTNVDDAITQFDCGVSLRNGNVEGVLSAVRRLREDAVWRIQLGRNARHAFETAYCTSAAEKAFTELRVSSPVH